MTTGLQCKPQNNLPHVEKVNHLAIRLGGATPDGVFNGGSVTIDLNSQAAKNLEAYIGYNPLAKKEAQPTLLAQHWFEVRALVESFQGVSHSTTIAQSSLSLVGPNSDFAGDTAQAAQLRAGVLIESAAVLLDIFGSNSACAAGEIARFSGTPAEIKSELPYLTTVASLYVRMGGEDDDGGLPDGLLATPVTLTDADLREIDTFLGYSPVNSNDPLSFLSLQSMTEAQKNWSAVREMITGLRNASGLIDNGTLTAAIKDPAIRGTAAVQLQTVVGVLRILRSEDWKAGLAYGSGESDANKGPEGLPHTAGTDYLVPLPNNATKWTAADKILIDGEPFKKNLKGLAEVRVPGSMLSKGTHTIEVVRSGSVVAKIVLNSEDSTWSQVKAFASENWPSFAGAMVFVGLGYLALRALSKKPNTSKNKPVVSTPPPPPGTEPMTAVTTTEQRTSVYADAIGSINPTPPETPKSVAQSFSIGRNPNAVIPLNISKMDPLKAQLISKEHVRITVKDGNYSAVDVGTNSNMAYILREGNYIPLSRDTNSPSTLQLNDILEIGGERLPFLGSPRDPSKPASAFGQAENVLASRSLIIQNNPVSTSNNGQNGAHVTAVTDENIALKIIDNFPNTMRGADGKSLHSDYQPLLNEMIAMVKADATLSPSSLEAIAARASDTVFKEYAIKTKAFDAVLRMEFVRLADMAEQKANSLEKTLKEARPVQ